jgi:hypothetical protein
MSNTTFHNKFHSTNHHSVSTYGYIDSGIDPIAGIDDPFIGTFYNVIPSYVPAISSNSKLWQSTFTTLCGNSADYFLFRTTYSTVTALSSNWQNGASFASTYSQVSSNYENTYTITNTYSANWPFLDTTYRLTLPQQATQAHTFKGTTLAPQIISATFYGDFMNGDTTSNILTGNVFNYVRNSSASFVDRDGQIRFVGENVARSNYEYNNARGAWQCEGALLERSNTNVVPYGADIVNWDVLPNNGMNWVSRTIDANNWTSVIQGLTGGTTPVYVACSSGGTAARLATSQDGINWTTQTSTNNYNWGGVAFGANVFAIVGSTGGGNRIITSNTGSNWVGRAAPEQASWTSVAYGGGIFVAVADAIAVGGTTLCQVMRSDTGVTWVSAAAAEGNAWTSVAYGNGIFVAVASSGANPVMVSSNQGATWTAYPLPQSNVWRSVTYGNGIFVAVASTGTNRVIISSDGVNWSTSDAIEPNSWYSVTYGNGIFVAVAQDGATRTMYSRNGKIWRGYPAAAALGWRAVTCGQDGLFVALSKDGAPRAMTTYFTETSLAVDGASPAYNLPSTVITPITSNTVYSYTMPINASTNYILSLYVKLGTLPAADYGIKIVDSASLVTLSSYTNILSSFSYAFPQTQWYRIAVPYFSATNTSIRVAPAYKFKNFNTEKTVYVWGAQLERNLDVPNIAPSSYIPTIGPSYHTRDTEYGYLSGDFLSNTEGTFLFETRLIPNTTAASASGFSLYRFTNVDASNAASLRYKSDYTVNARGMINNSTALGYDINSPNNRIDYPRAVALSYTVNKVTLADSGNIVATDIVSLVPGNLSSGFIAASAAGGQDGFTGYIRRIGYYPRRLSNNVLKFLTLSAQEYINVNQIELYNWDLSANQVAFINLSANAFVTNVAPAETKDKGGEYALVVQQDSTGGRTLVFDTDYVFSSKVYELSSNTTSIIAPSSLSVTVIRFTSNSDKLFGKPTKYYYNLNAGYTYFDGPGINLVPAPAGANTGDAITPAGGLTVGGSVPYSDGDGITII